MKKSLHYSLVAIASLLAVSALSACGGDGKIHVKFWHTMGQSNQATLNRMIAEFNKIYPDVVIDHSAQGDYTGLREKLNSAIPAGRTPTMAFCYPDHVADYMDVNAVIAVDDYINSEELGYTAEDGLLSDYVSSYWAEGQSYQVDGTYSVPFAKSTEVMFYNKTFFDENELTVPTTWTEMWELCRHIVEDIMPLQIDNGKGEMVKKYPDLEFPLGYDSDSNLFITLCEQRGIGYTTNENITKKEDHILFNNAEAKAMITELKGYYDAGYFKTKGCLPSNAYTSTYFTEFKTVMSIGSTGGTSYQTTTNFEVAVAPAPVTNEGDKFISQGPSICFFRKGTKEQKEAAWNFYKFITRANNTAAYSASTGYEPVRQSAFELPAYEEYLSGDSLQAKTSAVTASLEGRYYNSAVFYGSAIAREQVGGIFAKVVTNIATLEDAFAAAYSATVKATKM